MKFNFWAVCEIFFKIKFSKFIQDIRTLESFGTFLLIMELKASLKLDYQKSIIKYIHLTFMP